MRPIRLQRLATFDGSNTTLYLAAQAVNRADAGTESFWTHSAKLMIDMTKALVE